MIEAVCEELEVGAVIYDGGGERIYCQKLRLQYCRVNGINHIFAGEKGSFETRW